MLRGAARRLSRAAPSLQRAPAWRSASAAAAAARGDAAALPLGAAARCRAHRWRAAANARWSFAARGLSGGASHEPPHQSDDEEEEGDAQVLSEASLQSIVKVFTVHSSPNYYMPWQNKPQRESTGAKRAAGVLLIRVPSLCAAPRAARTGPLQVTRTCRYGSCAPCTPLARPVRAFIAPAHTA
jgi:hypothetical protein